MKKIATILGIGLLIAGAAFAQTTQTYTGTIRDLTGNPVTSGQVTFTLAPPTDSTIPGIGHFTPTAVNCNINADGTLSGYVAGIVSGACIVQANISLTPTGTSYRICEQPYFSTPGSCFFDYALGGTKDISSIAPTLSTGPINFGGVQGPPIDFLGVWSSTTVYQLGQAVSFNNAVYISLVNPNLNNTPASSPSQWSVVLSPASLIASPSVTQTVTQPVNTNFNVVTSGTGALESNGNPVVVSGPVSNQVITQPINTNLTINTSGTGSTVFNGNALFNHNKIQDDFNYFNYRFSSNDYQSPSVAATGRTWSNPEFYYSVNDNSAASTNPNPQGDLRMTPIIHIESFNNSPNDSSPIYLNHRCTYAVAPEATNGGCVGLMVAAQNTATSENGIMEAVNAITQIASTDPLVQAQSIESNMFNNSGVDSLLQPNTTFTRGPYFGISSTAGGNNQMVAGFHTTDQGHGSGWQYGLWVERASGADVLVGLPSGNGGTEDGIQLSPVNSATASTNFPSMPIGLRTSQWDGTNPSPFATQIRALPLTSGVTPVTCMNVSFTIPGSVANICSDGSIQVRGISWRTFGGAPSGNCTAGDFASNGHPASVNEVLYVCFPANTWNAIGIP